MFASIKRVRLRQTALQDHWREFLLRLVAAISYKIRTVNTGNGLLLTAPALAGSAVTLIKETIAHGEPFHAPAVERFCVRNDIEHCTTKTTIPPGLTSYEFIYKPWPNSRNNLTLIQSIKC